MLDLTLRPPRPLISASILSADFGCIAQDVRDVLARGVDLIHMDVMDGHFAPNLTMGVDMIRGLRRHFADLYLDVHLMVDRPSDYIDAYAEAGANLFSFHAEVSQPMRSAAQGGEDPRRMIDRVRGAGMSVAMVINPDTPADTLLPWIEELDMVLVMSVVPGFSGQKFMPGVLEKVRWLRARLTDRQRIEIDGGINTQTVHDAVAAGVDVVVTASALFGAADRSHVINTIHQARMP